MCVMRSPCSFICTRSRGPLRRHDRHAAADAPPLAGVRQAAARVVADGVDHSWLKTAMTEQPGHGYKEPNGQGRFMSIHSCSAAQACNVALASAAETAITVERGVPRGRGPGVRPSSDHPMSSTVGS
jgi:hypothetical protein